MNIFQQSTKGEKLWKYIQYIQNTIYVMLIKNQQLVLCMQRFIFTIIIKNILIKTPKKSSLDLEPAANIICIRSRQKKIKNYNKFT